jgi:hypothetical protein
MGSDRLLAIYLNDHLAGSAAARDRCRHARDRSGGEIAAFLDRLLGEIEEDRATLRRVMARVRATPSSLKSGLAVAAERAARLKPNGQLLGDSPLSRLLELDALSLGVEGKRLLWVALGRLGDPRLAEFDFAALAERALAQRDGLEQHRLAAALVALG